MASSWLVLVIAGLITVRSEGPLYALLLALILLDGPAVSSLSTGQRRRLAGVIGLMVAAQLAGRWLVFGQLLSTPTVAKGLVFIYGQQLLQGDQAARATLLEIGLLGLIYLWPLLVPILIGGLAALGLTHHRATAPGSGPLIRLLVGWLVLGLLISLLAGGDWMPFHRHLVAHWPLALLVWAWLLQQHGQTVLARVRPALVRSVGLGLALLAVGLVGVERAPRWPAGDWWVTHGYGRSPHKQAIGELVRAQQRPLLVVTNVAGKLAYYAGPAVTVLDLLGLTDTRNASGERSGFRFGRTDDDYTFGQPFQLLVTNFGGDVAALVAYTERHAEDQRRFLLCQRADWLTTSFFVIVPADEPLVAVLRDQAACQPAPLTRAVVERWRAEVKPCRRWLPPHSRARAG